MKVLHIINSLDTGGAEKLLLESLPLFLEKGVHVELLILKNTNAPFLEELKKSSSLKIHSLDTKSLYSPLILFRLIPLLRKYDIAHAHLFPTIYWVSLAKFLSKSKCKLLITEHNWSNRRMGNLIYRFIDRLIYKGYTYIITISEDVDKSIKAHLGLSNKKFKMILNGINIKTISDALPSSDKSIIDFIGEKTTTVIQVSAFQAQKDQATLIKSIALLPQEFNLLLVGDGELKANCEKLTNDLKVSDRVKFLGIRMDVPQLLKLSDIVVLSTRYEGLSLSSIEGMASGKPFVGANVSGLREVIEQAGMLFPQGNEKELAKIILSLKNDKRLYNNVAEACVKRSYKYDIHTMVTDTINLYRS